MMRFLLLLTLLAASCQRVRPGAPAAPATTVYVVRHAEKDLTPGLPDPPLTPAGQQRAEALRDTLAPRRIAAVFTTNTARTRATAAPLASARGLTPEAYDARQLPALARRIRRQHAGHAVLVVGHSNTILETVEALGAARPVPALTDADYNYLLVVSVPRDSTQPATAVARRVGR